MHDQIYKKIVSLLSTHTSFPQEKMEPCSELVLDLGLNSYDVVCIVTEFEDTFGISIPDKDLRSFKTIENITEYVENRS